MPPAMRHVLDARPCSLKIRLGKAGVYICLGGARGEGLADAAGDAVRGGGGVAGAEGVGVVCEGAGGDAAGGRGAVAAEAEGGGEDGGFAEFAGVELFLPVAGRRGVV